MTAPASHEIPRYDRRRPEAVGPITRVGSGRIGGKAQGLLDARAAILDAFPEGGTPELEISIPAMTVLTTEVFRRFMGENDLWGLALSDAPDRRIAHGFQRGDMPADFVGALRSIAERARAPLAIRSSSRLEDALSRPFAGVYETKMTPNNQLSPDERFRRLGEAVKLVWASTFFAAPKRYIKTTEHDITEEAMAVLIQEVVGRRRGDRFYPAVSGVARSYNFYPATNTRHEEGVVNLAIGLGKTIVDGGVCWFYPPRRPRTPPPFASAADRLDRTQRRFWAINMGEPPAKDPISEHEFLISCRLAEAEADGAIANLVSTYDPGADRLFPGVSRRGPRAVDFRPLLSMNLHGFNDALVALLESCERSMGAAVEIEFALTLPMSPGERARFGLLQVRPMVMLNEGGTVSVEELTRTGVLVASSRVIGHGVDRDIRDVVYLKPETFDAAGTKAMAAELERLNAVLLDEGRPYLLIGFGRWGSSDPYLGVPVSWDQICGARVIVEATLPSLRTELSHGSHFFHNLTNARVCYLMTPHTDEHGVDWASLAERPAMNETEHVRHVRLEAPLLVMVDGASRRGVIRWSQGGNGGDGDAGS